MEVVVNIIYVLNIKILIGIILKKMKSPTKIFLFTILDMLQ